MVRPHPRQSVREPFDGYGMNNIAYEQHTHGTESDVTERAQRASADGGEQRDAGGVAS